MSVFDPVLGSSSGSSSNGFAPSNEPMTTEAPTMPSPTSQNSMPTINMTRVLIICGAIFGGLVVASVTLSIVYACYARRRKARMERLAAENNEGAEPFGNGDTHAGRRDPWLAGSTAGPREVQGIRLDRLSERRKRELLLAQVLQRQQGLPWYERQRGQQRSPSASEASASTADSPRGDGRQNTAAATGAPEAASVFQEVDAPTTTNPENRRSRRQGGSRASPVNVQELDAQHLLDLVPLAVVTSPVMGENANARRDSPSEFEPSTVVYGSPHRYGSPRAFESSGARAQEFVEVPIEEVDETDGAQARTGNDAGVKRS